MDYNNRICNSVMTGPNGNEKIFLKWQTRSRHRSLDVQLINFGYPAQLLCSNEVSEVCWYLLLPFGSAFYFLAINILLPKPILFYGPWHCVAKAKVKILVQDMVVFVGYL